MKYVIGLVLAGVALLFLKHITMPKPPAVGSQAPAFNLLDADGKAHQLSDYAGQWLVIYFYPKDDTPGCTKEACQLRDHITQFRSLSVPILGVSLDNTASHKQFTNKYQIPFPLLSDDGTVAKQYGALWDWLFIKLAKRYTFLIDPDGRIAQRYFAVDPAQHAAELLAEIKVLSAK